MSLIVSIIQYTLIIFKIYQSEISHQNFNHHESNEEQDHEEETNQQNSNFSFSHFNPSSSTFNQQNDSSLPTLLSYYSTLDQLANNQIQEIENVSLEMINFSHQNQSSSSSSSSSSSIDVLCYQLMDIIEAIQKIEDEGY